MYIFSWYITGCVLSLLIYDVIIYEKYKDNLFIKYNKKDFIIGVITILSSWIFLLTFLIKQTNLKVNIMKTIKKIGKKIWESYKEGVEMQYRYLYYNR